MREKIKAEIERLKKSLPWGSCASQLSMECNCKNEAYNEILSYIDSLEEEPVSDDLEYASEKYACRFSSSKYGHDKVKDAFITGAQWQKERMLNNAIEREVKVDAGGYPYIDVTELYDYDKNRPLAKKGDKVKLIIIM
jgi:hypothetical protein